MVVGWVFSPVTGEAKPDKVLDCVGLYCPMPILQTSEEMYKLKMGQVLEVIADDPAAEEDLRHWAKTTGQELISLVNEAGKVHCLMRKRK